MKLRFTDDALEAIAIDAIKRNVGARGLRIILEDLMLDLMYQLPQQKDQRELTITKEMVLKQGDPAAVRKSWIDEVANVDAIRIRSRNSLMSTKEKYEQTQLPMVPIRDVVIFPFMMVPFVIGRESSVNALEAALQGRQADFPGHPARRHHRQSQTERDLSGRNDRQHRPVAQTARRQHQGSGRRHRARAHPSA